MAQWRHAVELAMSGEDIGRSTDISRSRTERASRVERAQMLLAYQEKPSFCAVGEKLGMHHQTVQGSGRWPMAHLRHWMTDRGRARSRRSRRKPRPGWCRWRATRPRSTVMRTNCGRHGFWPAMRASTDRRRDTNASPAWCKAQCARSSAKRKSSNQAAQGYPSPRTALDLRPEPGVHATFRRGPLARAVCGAARLWAGRRSAVSPLLSHFDAGSKRTGAR